LKQEEMRLYEVRHAIFNERIANKKKLEALFAEHNAGREGEGSTLKRPREEEDELPYYIGRKYTKISPVMLGESPDNELRGVVDGQSRRLFDNDIKDTEASVDEERDRYIVVLRTKTLATVVNPATNMKDLTGSVNTPAPEVPIIEDVRKNLDFLTLQAVGGASSHGSIGAADHDTIQTSEKR
jgi:hypothetical protein